MLTEPLPAPMSQTMLEGAMSIWASAIARTSAGVSRPCLGLDCRNASSGLPKRRRPTASRGRSGASGSRMRIITLSESNFCVGDFGERAAGDAFVAGAEVFADVGGEVVDAAIEQGLGDGGGAASGRW